MILLLDVGNTRIKWSQLLDGALTPQQTLLHKGVAPEVWTRQLFRERFRPSRLFVASVAGADMAATIRREAEKLWKVKAEFATTTSIAGGVTNAYPDPSALGVDRWLAVIAGREVAGGAACVIDAGTAVTIDVVGADGLHAGGIILPGVQMMMDSLLDRTSDIARKARKGLSAPSAEKALSSVFANHTAQAVLNGALLALASAADRAATEASRTLNATPKVLITGGDAERLTRLMQTRTEIVPDLVLRGLAILARKT